MAPRADYTIYDLSAGIDYHLSTTTFVTFSAGYFMQDITDGEPISGYVVRGDMAKRFSRGSVRLSGGTGYDQAYFGAENLGFTKFYSASLAGRYDITRHLAGEAFAEYRNSEYTDAAGRVEKISSYGASLNYRMNPWLLLTLRLVHRTADSTEPAGSYDENRISLGITMSPASAHFSGLVIGNINDWSHRKDAKNAEEAYQFTNPPECFCSHPSQNTGMPMKLLCLAVLLVALFFPSCWCVRWQRCLHHN